MPIENRKAKAPQEISLPKNDADKHGIHEHYEFGGPLGVTAMMIVFPVLMYYLWISVEFYNGKLVHPSSTEDIIPFINRMIGHFQEKALPTVYAFKIYTIFVVFEGLCAYFLPGPIVQGLPAVDRSVKGKPVKLDYQCNGVISWYITLITSFALHYFDIFPLTEIISNFASIMTVAILYGFGVTFITYFGTIWFGKPFRMSGNFLYDLFMGAPLHPRIGKLDLKMFVEIRIPWIILFYITLSAALQHRAEYGYVSPQLAFMVLAHSLYTNACMKGEEMIPTTWDIFYEKWGFMLIFWNFAGVPFSYCLSSLYLLKVGPLPHSLWYNVACFGALIVAYYVWDTANSQKNRFRMQMAGTYIPRKTFPQLPWGTLEKPTYIKTKQGSTLLTGGWWGVARKIHYTADLTMSLSWGLITGFSSFVPYFYFVFFLSHLQHRVRRDMARCAEKYGQDWKDYCKQVPYIFIPYVY